MTDWVHAIKSQLTLSVSDYSVVVCMRICIEMLLKNNALLLLAESFCMHFGHLISCFNSLVVLIEWYWCDRAHDVNSGIVLTVFTNQLAIRIYTGDDLNFTAKNSGGRYLPHSGFLLETQGYPDAVHHVCWLTFFWHFTCAVYHY